jgi:hypothetical protein
MLLSLAFPEETPLIRLLVASMLRTLGGRLVETLRAGGGGGGDSFAASNCPSLGPVVKADELADIGSKGKACEAASPSDDRSGSAVRMGEGVEVELSENPDALPNDPDCLEVGCGLLGGGGAGAW